MGTGHRHWHITPIAVGGADDASQLITFYFALANTEGGRMTRRSAFWWLIGVGDVGLLGS